MKNGGKSCVKGAHGLGPTPALDHGPALAPARLGRAHLSRGLEAGLAALAAAAEAAPHGGLSAVLLLHLSKVESLQDHAPEHPGKKAWLVW